MLTAGKKMVVNVEYLHTSVTVPRVSGETEMLVSFMDYTVIVTDSNMACECFSRRPVLPISFLVPHSILPESSGSTGPRGKKQYGIWVFRCWGEVWESDFL